MPTASSLFMTTREVSQLTHIPEATLRWWRVQGGKEGPPSFSLSPRKVVYKRTSVMAWIAAREEASRVGSLD